MLDGPYYTIVIQDKAACFAKQTGKLGLCQFRPGYGQYLVEWHSNYK